MADRSKILALVKAALRDRLMIVQAPPIVYVRDTGYHQRWSDEDYETLADAVVDVLVPHLK